MSLLHPGSWSSSRVRRVIPMMFISFSLGENVCDVLASLMATYHEIVTYFGQDDPTSRTMMEVILRTR
jgi:hypothetical protein